MLQSITIEKPVLGLGQEWLIEYARAIDGSVFADRTTISQYAAFERALTLIEQGFDVIRITEPGGRIIHADEIADFYLTLSRRGMPNLPEEAMDLPAKPETPRRSLIRRPPSRKLMLAVWIALSLTATATAVVTLFPGAIGVVGPHGTVSAEPTYR